MDEAFAHSDNVLSRNEVEEQKKKHESHRNCFGNGAKKF